MDPIRLLFDSRNHLMVAKGANSVYDLLELEAGSYVWHNLTSLSHQEIHCAVLTKTGETTDNWQTIFNLHSLPQTSKLEAVLEQRKSANADESYVSSLYTKGLDEILKKIGEESAEVIMASKDGNQDKIVHEVADLWFHTLVLLRHKDIEIDKIQQELSKRFGLSGLEEKANRNN